MIYKKMKTSLPAALSIRSFAMQLVLFIENEFGIKIESDDLNLDNFRSIQALANLVERKTIATV